MLKFDSAKRRTLRMYGRGLLAASAAPMLPMLMGAAAVRDKNTGEYPSRTIDILVGFAPGGGTDVVARLIAKKFTDEWGESAVVINRPGASGNIANSHVAKAAPDGYTLLVAVSSLVINPSLYKQIPYDTERDFQPVSLLTMAPNILAVHPDVDVRTAKDLIELARAKPGAISYASPGTGQASHLAMELLATMAGVKFLHVPYNGGGPSVTAAMGGQTQLVVGSLPTILPAVRNGNLRAIGVTTAKRTSLAPNIPSIAEQTGLSDYDANVWYGLLAPAGTPRPIIDKLNAEVRQTLAEKDVEERFFTMGFETAYTTPEDLGALIKSDLAKWAQVANDAGITLG